MVKWRVWHRCFGEVEGWTWDEVEAPTKRDAYIAVTGRMGKPYRDEIIESRVELVDEEARTIAAKFAPRNVA